MHTQGDTCLHLACLYPNEAIFDVLLQAGADVKVADENGGTVLHDAAASGCLTIVERLLELAPELVRRADRDEETPLHCAARGAHTAVVAALLRHGADKDVRNTFGQTALMLVDPIDVDTARVLA